MASLELALPAAGSALELAGTNLTLVVTVAVFAWFWPVYTAQVIPYQQWWLHMWFPSWV